jgi:hypothetical protein
MRMLMVLCAALALTFGVATSSSAVKPQTISVLEVDTSFAPIGGLDQTGNAPPAIGQGFTFGGILYKWAGAKRGKAVGHVAAMCTVVTKTHLFCNGSLLLSGGVIEVLGPVSIQGEDAFDIPVVGGTGAYAGARGVMRSTRIGEDSNKSSLVIHLL